ncbi:MAG: hypothetical protein IPN32_24965 [Deltaproteobacteria bacterium]|nr:hypothetical protein [Deltaproteobacteria bacterium]
MKAAASGYSGAISEAGGSDQPGAAYSGRHLVVVFVLDHQRRGGSGRRDHAEHREHRDRGTEDATRTVRAVLR